MASGSNLNDSSLAYIAERKFGGDKVAAATWQTQNPTAYQKEIERYLDKSQSGMQPRNAVSRTNVNQHHSESRQNIASLPTSNPGLDDTRQKHNLNQGGYELEATLQARRQEARHTIKQHKERLGNDEFQREFDASDKAFESEKSKMLIKKSWNKIWK